MGIRNLWMAALVAAFVWPCPTRAVTHSSKTKSKPKAEGARAVDGSLVNDRLAPAVRDILQKVETAQTSVKDVRMDLKMTVQDRTMGTKQTVKGRILIKTPDRLMTHYTSPTEQFLYINGKSLQMYQPEQNMVYKQSAEKGQPAYLGVGQELKRYAVTSRVSIVKDSSDRVVLLFVPDGGESQYKRMKVTIRKTDWWPEKVEIQSATMSSQAQFSNPVFNEGIPDSEFKFTPPSGTSVVEGEIF